MELKGGKMMKKTAKDSIFSPDMIKDALAKNPFENVGKLVYEALEEAIYTKRLKPASRLNVARISNELGVSGTPVREAIDRLVAKGLVTEEPNDSGKQIVYKVFEFTKDEIYELFLTREAIEVAAVRWCAEHNYCVDVDALYGYAKQYFNGISLYTKGGPHEGEFIPVQIAQYDRSFHRATIEATGNRHMIEFYDQVERELTYLSILDGPASEIDNDRLLYIAGRHIAICRAIKAGFTTVAAELALEHLKDCLYAILSWR